MTIKRCRPSDRDPDRNADEQVWCLYSKDGDKLLGRHKTKEEARKQEVAVQIHKRLGRVQRVLARLSSRK